MKWIGLILALAGLGIIVMLVYGANVSNPDILQQLHDEPNGTRAGIVMSLTLPSGKILPVNYLREGKQVFVGADGPWWRALAAGDVPVEMFIRGETIDGKARVVFDDPEYTREIFKRLRPNAPAWLPDWLNGYLVVIDLHHNLD